MDVQFPSIPFSDYGAAEEPISLARIEEMLFKFFDNIAAITNGGAVILLNPEQLVIRNNDTAFNLTFRRIS